MDWLWTVEQQRYRLTAAPLPQWLGEAAFHGRGLAPDAPPAAADVVLDQVHGSGVARADGPGRFDACDAVVTSTPGLRLLVRTADCLPLILSDPSPRLAVIHAGWRGLVGGVVEAALSHFPEPTRLRVILGPVIGVCCFEVGTEVAARFPSGSVQPREPRPHVDLAADARRRLLAAGVRPEYLSGPGPCPQCHQHLLYSYRGGSGAPGRIETVAAIRS